MAFWKRETSKNIYCNAKDEFLNEWLDGATGTERGKPHPPTVGDSHSFPKINGFKPSLEDWIVIKCTKIGVWKVIGVEVVLKIKEKVCGC